MAGRSFAIIGWIWTDVSVLGSHVFGQALMDSCGIHSEYLGIKVFLDKTVTTSAMFLRLQMYNTLCLKVSKKILLIWFFRLYLICAEHDYICPKNDSYCPKCACFWRKKYWLDSNTIWYILTASWFVLNMTGYVLNISLPIHFFGM